MPHDEKKISPPNALTISAEHDNYSELLLRIKKDVLTVDLLIVLSKASRGTQAVLVRLTSPLVPKILGEHGRLELPNVVLRVAIKATLALFLKVYNVSVTRKGKSQQT